MLFLEHQGQTKHMSKPDSDHLLPGCYFWNTISFPLKWQFASSLLFRAYLCVPSRTLSLWGTIGSDSPLNLLSFPSWTQRFGTQERDIIRAVCQFSNNCQNWIHFLILEVHRVFYCLPGHGTRPNMLHLSTIHIYSTNLVCPTGIIHIFHTYYTKSGLFRTN